MRIYLDTNAIQGATALFPSGAALEKALDAHGHVLSLGGHVMYELARAFVTGRADPCPVLRVLSEMDQIHYVPQPEELIQNEVYRLRTGGVALDFVRPSMAAAIKSELYFLSKGHVDQAREFIAAREQKFTIGHAQIAQANRTMLRGFVRQNPQLRGQLRTWDGFRQSLRPLWGPIVLRVAGDLPQGLVERFFDRPADFPVVNTWLRVQLHLMFLSSRAGELPAQGRVDDYRNVIESNAAELFVTSDEKLLRRFADVNPFRAASSWDTFLASL